MKYKFKGRVKFLVRRSNLTSILSDIEVYAPYEYFYRGVKKLQVNGSLKTTKISDKDTPSNNLRSTSLKGTIKIYQATKRNPSMLCINQCESSHSIISHTSQEYSIKKNSDHIKKLMEQKYRKPISLLYYRLQENNL